jgi:hypothetical protein
MHHWMFNCKEVTRMVSESMDRSLPFFQRMGIRFHLMMCKFCTRYRKQLLILREAIRLKSIHDEEIELPISLPPEAKTRIRRLLVEK